MLNNKNKKIIFALLRSLVVFFLFIGVNAYARAFIADYFLENDEISKGFANKFWNIWCIFIAVLSFNSISRTLKLNNKAAKESYLERFPTEQSFLSNVRDTLRDVEFWIEMGVITVFSLILPISATYSYVSLGVFGKENKLYALLLVIPIIFVFELIITSLIKAQYRYIKEPKKKTNEIWQNTKSLALLSAIYCWGFNYCMVAIFPFVATICFAFRGHNPFAVLASFAGIILSIVAIIYVFAYIRAIKIRRAFVKELHNACRRIGAKLSESKNPYLSIFGKKTDVSFTVEKSGKKYACKLVASILKNTPMTFFDNGDMMCHYTFRIFKVDLFHFVTQSKLGFESDGTKIFILLPVPKKFFVASASDEAHRSRPADIGEILGEYQIYSGSGFINALERDCIGRK